MLTTGDTTLICTALDHFGDYLTDHGHKDYPEGVAERLREQVTEVWGKLNEPPFTEDERNVLSQALKDYREGVESAHEYGDIPSVEAADISRAITSLERKLLG